MNDRNAGVSGAAAIFKHQISNLGGGNRTNAETKEESTTKDSKLAQKFTRAMEICDLVSSEHESKDEDSIIENSKSATESKSTSFVAGTYMEDDDKIKEATKLLQESREIKEDLDSHCLFCAVVICPSKSKMIHTLERLELAGLKFEVPVPRLPERGIFSEAYLSLTKYDTFRPDTSHLKHNTYYEYDKTRWISVILERRYPSNPEIAVEAVCFLLQRMDAVKGFKYIQEVCSEIEIRREHLQLFGNKMAEVAKFPITLCLEIAQLCNELAHIYLVDASGYKTLNSVFTKSAINMMNDFEMDHQAAFALTELDVVFHSPLYVAIKSRNIEFIGSPRVSRIVNTMWSQPVFMKSPQFTSSGSSWKEFALTLITEPKQFMLIPAGKFMINSFSFVSYLFLFSYLCALGVGIHDPISGYEVTVWIMALGFNLNQIREIYEIGTVKYFQQDWSAMDLTIFCGYILIIGLRLAPEANDTIKALYQFWMSFDIVLLWIRFTYIFQVHPTLGPLLRTTIVIISQDVTNFAVLVALFVAGFSVSLNFVLSDEIIDGFNSLGSSFLTVYGGFLGVFDFHDFFDIRQSAALKVFVIILFAVCLAILHIIMLNLLIAMMSKTYNSVIKDSMNEYVFAKAKLCWKLDISHNELPPPFNILTTILFLINATLKKIYRNFASAFQSAKTTGTTSKILDEDSEIDAQGVVNAGTVFATSSKNGTPTSHWNLEWPWICARCHFLNQEYQPGPILRSNANNKEGTKTIRLKKGQLDALKSSAELPAENNERLTEGNLVSGESVVCQNCWRVAHPISKATFLREKIDTVVFIFTIWLPLVLCMVVPYCFFFLFENAVQVLNYREHRRKERVSSAVDRLPKKNPEQIKKRSQRKFKIRQCFEEPPLSVKELADDVEIMKESIQKLARKHNLSWAGDKESGDHHSHRTSNGVSFFEQQKMLLDEKIVEEDEYFHTEKPVLIGTSTQDILEHFSEEATDSKQTLSPSP